ncbi:putative AT-hook motif nuclear-localized protein [Helianthus annuus]|uniref:AT-hook motif nuclear-localized protein n=1 Tax=Helianthus annuus TaxID=4232 RepID=A0A9K3HUG8_HELAN|nr:putative AT-hook motif nuclear-localized protein [Helianthus annuus]KAJ0512376.1 putative AT-hook motif nuclear-localized protein [Helianthus annuus]KAJ0528482.1 putative AT-hook motif nuclear-localized protein [Helianthus annuus]
MDLGDRIAFGGSFTPHMVTFNPGEDVTSKIILFTKDGPQSVCILSAVGVISHVTLPHAWPALSVGGEDHQPGPDISRGTFFYEKSRYVYVKYLFNRVHSYKHQHRPPYKTIIMV